MSARFDRIAVVGLGLLGGSVAGAARRRGVAARVVGVTRSREAAALARERGAVDEVATDVASGVRGAGLVVLATPVTAMAEVLRAAAPALAEGTLVTDVGSVKGCLAETLPGLLPPGVHYVGAHPMAGSHQSGLRHARPDLLEGAACVVTPGPHAPAEAREAVCAFWRDLGTRVLVREPAVHDREVAWVSHAPHALAFAFAHALAGAPGGAGEVRGGGFRDFTRIAWSDPELWSDILVHNRKAVAEPLAAAAEGLAALSRLLEAGDGDALHRFLANARESLARVANDARSGGDHPEIQAAPDAAAKE